MRIAIDARILKTGIGSYTQRLIEKTIEILNPQDELIVLLKKEDWDKIQTNDVRISKVEVNFKPYSFGEQFKYLFILRKLNVDLIHFTNFNVPILWWGKYVVTIHDLIHLKFSTFGNDTQNYIYYLIKKAIYVLVIKLVSIRAKVVITDSNATKRDLVSILKVNPRKIEVIKLAGNDRCEPGTNDLNAEEILSKYKITNPYILYAATMYPHKNHERLINAFQLIHAKHPEIQLVLVGKVDNLSKRVYAYAESRNLLESIIFPNYQVEGGYLPNEELACLYQNARLYVYPSLIEGFGIPVLEAQEYRLPVVASKIECFEEVGEDSVLYFDPYDVEDIAKKVEQLYLNEGLQSEFIQKGLENIQKYSWIKVAEDTMGIYKSVM